MIHASPGSPRAVRIVAISFMVLLLTGACKANISATDTPEAVVGSTVFSGIYVADPSQAIDIVFVPDDDYGNMSVVSMRQAFLDDVSDMVNNGFWMNQVWHVNFLRVNYWFMTQTGNVAAGTGTCPSVTWPNLTDASFAEAIVLLHSNQLRDCAWGNKVTSEPTSYRTVVHEVSHAAWGLPDEYCCDGGYWSVPPVLYPSSASCNSDPANAAWRDCQPVNSASSSSWWRSEDTNCDIMACDGSVVLEYGPADWVIVKAVLQSLPGGGAGAPSVFAPNEWP